MAIGPIEMTGMVTRTQDFSQFKVNEDNKAVLDQSNIYTNVQKKVQEQNKQVINPDNADYHEYRYDAKEKGNGTNQDKRKQKKKEEKEEDGTVTVKKPSGFDIRI